MILEANKQKIIFKQAPLPFMGQKKKMLDPLFRALSTFGLDKSYTFIDAFGGSGLLSHNIKQEYNENKVVFNDYDNYQSRLDLIKTTEEVRAKLAEITPKECKRKISTEVKNKIIKLLDSYEDTDLDFITLSTYLLFSGNYALNRQAFYKETFFNRVRLTKINEPKGYLENVIKESGDFRDIIEKYKNEKLILILDPPYLMTNMLGYKYSFNLKDTLELLKIIQGVKYFVLFTSSGSDTNVLLDFLGIKYKTISRKLLGSKNDLLFFGENEIN